MTPYHFPRHLYSCFALFSSSSVFISFYLNRAPHFPHFLRQIHVPNYFPLNCPAWCWSAFTFLVVVVTPGSVCTSEDLELGPSDERTCDSHLSLSG